MDKIENMDRRLKRFGTITIQMDDQLTEPKYMATEDWEDFMDYG